ncbi:nipped-B-like protein B [Senna tora]|uniref:Nipped-B-like protein B n=1 Tax=Senna tora TaxID=362788 RepID=A0A834T6W0_9FABA|nr:nipped-B-like protein B [Senna tora]
MPRSSKHKSSKHSSRDTRDYSDSDKDSSLKDRKSKDESTVKVSKDSSSVEKRKSDSKDVHGFGNGDNSDEYASSRRRKERSNDGVGDRWNGGEDEREGSKRSKTSGDSKSRRRDESVGVYGEGEEIKKSSSKGDGKHKDSGRKESRESVTEKERKFKESRSEKSVDNEEQRTSKQVYENTGKILFYMVWISNYCVLESMASRIFKQSYMPIALRLSEGESIQFIWDKHLDSRALDELRSAELDNQLERRMRKKKDDTGEGIKHQDDGGDGYNRRLSSRDDIAKDGKQKDEKRKDEKHREKCREETDKENKHRYDKQRDERPTKDHTSNRSDDKHGKEEKDDDRSAKSKESGAKKRSLGDRDDYSNTKSRGVKTHHSDAEKRSLSSSKADSDADRGRSQPRQAHADSTGTSNKRKSSPAPNAHIGKDEYRNVNSEDSKYRDSMIEQRKGMREGYSGTSERSANKYKSVEKSNKIDDGTIGDYATERSSSSKASPMGLVERSPSSTSIERRYVNKSGVRRSLEIEESGRRTSVDARDFSTSEDRLGRELTIDRPQMDESSQADSSYYGRTSQGNAPLIPPPPAFRAGLDRPFMGSLEDDVRDSSNARYRRISDPGFGRGHSNSWRGVPNWTSPVPNGFVPFQHGPTHGGFQAIMPQFPSQPLFGVRPPMEVNHAGIPYHIPDADRFPGHLRPLGWQNMMDGTGPSHLHGWDGNNGVFRDDPHMYGGSDWERNRHSTNSRSWESGSETWKEQNGDLKKDLPSPAHKDAPAPAPAEVDDGLAEQDSQMSKDEGNQDVSQDKAPEIKLPSFSTPSKAPLKSLSTPIEKVPEPSTSDNASLFSRVYLSKLDISKELALSELHDQCMCLLSVDKKASNGADSRTDLFLKNGSGAQLRYAATISRHSPFPAIDTSIFQRAIDLYKKQRVELPNREKVDIIPASNQVQGNESVPIPSLENMQISVSTCDARVNMPLSTLGPKTVATICPPAEEHLEELDQMSSQKQQDHVCSNSLELILSGPSDHENKGEPLAALGEKEDKDTSEMVNSGDFEEKHSMEVENNSPLAPVLREDEDDMNSKAKTTDFAQCGDGKPGFDETLGDPLIFEDGSSKACDALMGSSNESESLILSRIHHSPESTH